MPRLALTDLSIRALKMDGAQVDYWDTKTSGFGIRIGKRTKAFVAKVDNRRITIGQYPLLSLQEARRLALGLKSEGGDPSCKTPFKEALDTFFEVHVPTLKPRTQREIKRTLNRHFLPELKGKKLSEIVHADITAITDELLDTPSEAWHAFKDVRTFFNWCVPRYIAHSPCEGLKSPARYVPRKRVLTYDEIRTIWVELGKVDYPFSQIVKLLVMVNCTEDFGEQPQVANGASDLLVELFGERGKHARSAVGMQMLPSNIPVEIEMVVEIR